MDLSKVKIRKVEEADIVTMTEHRIVYLTELQGERSEEYKEELRIQLNSYFKTMMSQGHMFAMVGECEGEVLAYGCMILKKIPGDFDDTSHIEGDILNMYTIPKARRNGISTLILTNLLQEAQTRGLSKVSLHTTLDGEPLYRKFGFKYPDDYPYMELVLDKNNELHFLK